MQKNIAADFILKLLEASDYRSFIVVLIEDKNKLKKFGYADIARLGGFSARSFPRDVVKGTKRITLASLPKFVRGLQLNTDLAEYFKTLVELEHIDCRTKFYDELKLQEMKLKYKERILAKYSLSKVSSDNAFKVSSLPEVYAALGSVEKGASIAEICERTTLEPFEIELALEQMVTAGIALKKKARFYPKQTHLNIEGLSQSEVFKKHFVWSSERSARMVKSGLSSDSKLFLSSAISVNEADLPKLKEELRSLLLKFLDSSEKTNGNKVVNIVTSMF